VTLVVGGVASARAAEGAGRYANPQLLVETEEVARMLAAPDARIVDLRSEMTGWVGYRVGHVPGAAHLEVGELDDQGANAEGLPVRLAAAAAMFGRLGIDHETTVVAYDDAGGLCAARLGSWMEWANTPTRPVER
jgi:thiosulfate/3-mercaptopyruvate sulfurtransferase